MCMVDGADPCEVWDETWRRARKSHKCCECGREIAAGERYKRIFMVFDGDASDFKQCSHCAVAADWLVKVCGGYLVHGVSEDLSEHMLEVGYKPIILARLIHGMREGWKWRDGTMRPVPVLPATLMREVRPSFKKVEK